jgi:hypothetical protein
MSILISGVHRRRMQSFVVDTHQLPALDIDAPRAEITVGRFA